MRGRLHTRVFLHFLGVLAVVGAVTSVVFFTGWRSAFPRSLTERMMTFAAAEVAEHFDDPPGRSRVVGKLAAQLGVDVVVRDPSGLALVSRGSPLPGLSADERAQAEEAPIFLHRGREWYVAGPIRDAQSGKLLGLFEATPVRRFRSPSPLRPALTAILALVIVGVLSVPLARRISRPVEALTEATRRFGAGELSARVPVPEGRQCAPGEALDEPRWRHRRGRRRPGRHRSDELEELSRAWNEMADRVEHLVRGQKELLANVSHELRSPLARIRMALELLPRDEAGEARMRDIELDIGELDRLIDDVLTASRLEATGLPAHPEPVQIAPLFEGIKERAALDPLVAGREVTVLVEGALGETITADAALLRRALWNLVENAAKYGAPPITLSARRVGERVELAVSDEGPGIPAADRARVLDAFARLDKARTPSAAGQPHRGFGLGLTIARRVAEVHKGSIRIEAARSEGGVERGCRIAIELPG